jgi:hypothetical protein
VKLSKFEQSLLSTKKKSLFWSYTFTFFTHIIFRAMLFEQLKLTTFWDNSFVSFTTKNKVRGGERE